MNGSMVAARRESRVFACGDCADRIELGGGRKDPSVKEISMGAVCAVHPTPAVMQATWAVLLGTWTRPIASAEPDELEGLDELPAAIGPLTRIALDLLSAWSTAAPANVDDVMVRAAVGHARALLRLTKGR